MAKKFPVARCAFDAVPRHARGAVSKFRARCIEGFRGDAKMREEETMARR
jgi:hypothetical protein